MVNEMLLMMSGDIESNPGPSKYLYCVLIRPTQGWSGHQAKCKKLHNSQLFRGCEAAKKPLNFIQDYGNEVMWVL